MFKACSRCGRIHDFNYKCNKGRINTNEQALRRGSSWTNKSKKIRERSFNLCAVCRDNNVYTYDGLEVHHITKLKDNPSGLLDDNNLICLCVYHHKQADRGELDKDYLLSLVKARDT